MNEEEKERVEFLLGESKGVVLQYPVKVMLVNE